MQSVTVIIPAYNAELYLSEAIDSVLHQCFQKWHLVIVDDGSQDKTLTIAQQFARQDERIQVVQQKNSGVSAARNLGVAASLVGTDYLLFLDSDDYLEPEALEVLTNTLLISPEAGAAYGLPRFVTRDRQFIEDDITQAFGYYRKHVSRNGMGKLEGDAATRFDSLVIWPCIATPGQVLVRRTTFLEVGGYDELAHLSEDWDFWLRLSLKAPFIFVRQIMLNKRNHASNVSGDGRRMATAEAWLRRKIVSAYNLSAEQRHIAQQGHKYSCFVKLGWAAEDMKWGKIINCFKSLWRAFRSYILYLKMHGW